MRKAMFHLVIVFFAFAFPARAETLQETFEVRLFGLPVGQFVLAVNSNASAYAATSKFRTNGAVDIVVMVRFAMRARGAGKMPDFRSRSYSDEITVGPTLSTANYTFSDGDRRIDPLTGILAALVDRAVGTGCAFDKQTFDGVRALQVEIHEIARTDDGGLTCGGQALRVSGYSAADLEEAKGFPFKVRFAAQGDRLVAVKGEVDTIFGKVALVRK